jgi:hypothetical protein
MEDIKQTIEGMLADISDPKALIYIYQVVKALYLKEK